MTLIFWKLVDGLRDFPASLRPLFTRRSHALPRDTVVLARAFAIGLFYAGQECVAHDREQPCLHPGARFEAFEICQGF